MKIEKVSTKRNLYKKSKNDAHYCKFVLVPVLSWLPDLAHSQQYVRSSHPLDRDRTGLDAYFGWHRPERRICRS